MTRPPSDRTRTHDLVLAMSLAAVTGYFDGVAFTKMFSVFVANQSGNVVLLGVGIGQGSWGQSWRPALSMVAFVGGVVGGVLLARRVPPRRRAMVLLLVEAALIAAVAASAGDLADRSGQFTGMHAVVLLALSALAMGVQTDVIRRVAQVSVATTYSSGTLVKVGDEITALATEGWGAVREIRPVLTVLGLVVAMYVAGAAVGSAVVDSWGHGLWVAATVAAVLAIWLMRSPMRDPDGPNGDPPDPSQRRD